MALLVTSLPTTVDLELSDDRKGEILEDNNQGLCVDQLSSICRCLATTGIVTNGGSLAIERQPEKTAAGLVKECIAYHGDNNLHKKFDICRSFKNMSVEERDRIPSLNDLLTSCHQLAGIIVDMNDDLFIVDSQMTIFHQTPCYMPICDYLERFTTYLYTSEHVLVLTCVYMLRLANKIVINSQSIHRVILAAIVVATKMVEDKFPSNQSFSIGGGVENWELNMLEVEMLSLFDFNAMISWEEYNCTVKLLANIQDLE
mmetsp:Transcript_61423/g.70413  ORF Transcript_61423/g.70413 Transcript_61423/m.70413 type:complete len:258 (+) Transcript_61423:332-1105(+)